MRVWARRQRAAVEYVVERGGHDAGCDGGNRIVAAAHEGGDAALVKVYRNVGREGVRCLPAGTATDGKMTLFETQVKNVNTLLRGQPCCC